MARLSLKDVSVAPTPTSGSLFRPVSFELESGQVVLVSGPSGAGKSTLLRAIARLTPRFSGEILLDGNCPAGSEVPDYRGKVCYLPQVPSAHDETVAEVLRRPFRYQTARSRKYSNDVAEGHLGRLGLRREFLDKSFHDLSIGERQRVCLVRALMIEPLFLLLDEPTSALDSENAQTLYEELEAMPNHPGLVIVSHDDVWKAKFAKSTLVELIKP